jgi:hypothetical protein
MARSSIVVAALIVAFSLSLLNRKTAASDWIGIYARIDKVVFEPGAIDPERVQIWGAFALASKENRNSYEPARRGYLYYSLKPGKEEVCRKEWADLKAKAGTDQIIGFGGRDMPTGHVRKADEKATDPDVYPVGFGLVKMSDRGTNYPPIVELKSLPRGQK